MAIYFILNRRRNAVKIGFSTNPGKRISSIQTSAPDVLRIVGVCPGEVAEERALHERFDDIRLRGEWFKATAELLEFAKELCAGHKLRGRCPRCGRANMELHDDQARDAFVCQGCDPDGFPDTLRRSQRTDPPRTPAGGGYRIVHKRKN